MREFFRGWRRKVGVLTLALVCAFVVCWIRSWSKLDSFSVFPKDVSHQLFSGDGTIGYSRARAQIADSWRYQSTLIVTENQRLPIPDKRRLSYCHEWSGFCYGEYEHPEWEERIVLLTIPYWSIVMPLTMISAYLLLSQSRPRKPPEATRPSGEAKVIHA